MRTAIFLLLMLFCRNLSKGQNLVRKDTIQIPFKVIQNGERLLDIEVQRDRIFFNSSRVELIPVHQLHLQDGDLILDYELKGLENNFFYDLHFFLQEADGTELVLKPQRIKGHQGRIDSKKGSIPQVIWRDLTEDALFYGQNYRLEIVNELWGKGLDCSQKPKLGFKEQWPLGLTGLIGAGLIGLGEVRKNQAKDLYSNYENLWTNGKSKADGITAFNAFDDKMQAHKTFTKAGALILGVDGILYVLQVWSHKKKIRRFNNYCLSRDVSLNLQYWNGFEEPSLGVSMTAKF